LIGHRILVLLVLCSSWITFIFVYSSVSLCGWGFVLLVRSVLFMDVTHYISVLCYVVLWVYTFVFVVGLF